MLFRSGALRKLVADPQLTTSSLESAIEQWVTSQATRDLCSLTREMQATVTWKNAPKASTLSKYSGLFVKLACVCPNGVITPTKLASALIAVNKTQAINFSGMQLPHFGDFYSELLRACFSKYRQILNESDARLRLFSKVISPMKTGKGAGGWGGCEGGRDLCLCLWVASGDSLVIPSEFSPSFLFQFTCAIVALISIYACRLGWMNMSLCLVAPHNRPPAHNIPPIQKDHRERGTV